MTPAERKKERELNERFELIWKQMEFKFQNKDEENYEMMIKIEPELELFSKEEALAIIKYDRRERLYQRFMKAHQWKKLE